MSFLDNLFIGGGPATQIATTGAPVTVNGSTPPAGSGESLTSTSPTTATWQPAGDASNLATTGAPVNVSGAAPGAAGDVLQLDSATTASWHHRPNYLLPVELFVAPGELLTTSNFESALFAAITTAYASATGATITIPSGVWPMTESVLLVATGRAVGITIKGAGRYETLLQWPAGFVGNCIEIDGSNTGSVENFMWGGICDLTIAGDYDDCAATGLVISKAIMSQLRNLGIEGFLGTGGMGLDVRQGEDSNNSQNLLFDNIHISLNDQGSRFKAITQFTATHIQWNNNQTLDHEWAGFCSGTINGYMFQSGPIPSMVTSNPNPGGNRIVFEGQGYHEASTPFSPYLLKTYEPTDTFDSFSFGDGVSANGYVQLFDLTGCSFLRCGHFTAAPETTLWIKARNCGQIIFEDGPDPLLVPTAYDLDQYSRVGLSTQRDGLPYFGQTSRGTTIEGILRAKAAEGWDLGKRATLTLATAGTEVSAIAGLIHGASATPGTMNNPTFNPASKHANWQAAVQLTENAVTGKGLKATLGTPIPIGSYVGMFVVMRCQDTGPAVNIRGPVLYNSGTGENYGIGAADVTNNTHIYGQFVVSGTDRPIGGLAGQTVHAILIQPDTDKRGADSSVHNALYVDNDTRIVTGNAGQAPTTSALSTLWFSGIDDRSANLTIYELWILTENLAPGEITQLMELAREKYGIPEIVTTSVPTAAPSLAKAPATSTAHALVAFKGTNGDDLEDSGVVLGTGVGTFLATPSSANLKAALTDETGSGAAVFATNPVLVTPALGVPTAIDLSNATSLPVSTGISGLASGVAAFLATPSSANLKAVLTDETGSGAAVFATSPTLVTPALGTPSAINLANASGFANPLEVPFTATTAGYVIPTGYKGYSLKARPGSVGGSGGGGGGAGASANVGGGGGASGGIAGASARLTESPFVAAAGDTINVVIGTGGAGGAGGGPGAGGTAGTVGTATTVTNVTSGNVYRASPDGQSGSTVGAQGLPGTAAGGTGNTARTAGNATAWPPATTAGTASDASSSGAGGTGGGASAAGSSGTAAASGKASTFGPTPLQTANSVATGGAASATQGGGGGGGTGGNSGEGDGVLSALGIAIPGLTGAGSGRGGGGTALGGAGGVPTGVAGTTGQVGATGSLGRGGGGGEGGGGGGSGSVTGGAGGSGGTGGAGSDGAVILVLVRM